MKWISLEEKKPPLDKRVIFKCDAIEPKFYDNTVMVGCCQDNEYWPYVFDRVDTRIANVAINQIYQPVAWCEIPKYTNDGSWCVDRNAVPLFDVVVGYFEPIKPVAKPIIALCTVGLDGKVILHPTTSKIDKLFAVFYEFKGWKPVPEYKRSDN